MTPELDPRVQPGVMLDGLRLEVVPVPTPTTLPPLTIAKLLIFHVVNPPPEDSGVADVTWRVIPVGKPTLTVPGSAPVVPTIRKIPGMVKLKTARDTCAVAAKPPAGGLAMVT